MSLCIPMYDRFGDDREWMKDWFGLLAFYKGESISGSLIVPIGGRSKGLTGAVLDPILLVRRTGT